MEFNNFECEDSDYLVLEGTSAGLKPMTEEEAEGCPEAQWDFENM
jgi:hypothetical protein